MRRLLVPITAAAALTACSTQQPVELALPDGAGVSIADVPRDTSAVNEETLAAAAEGGTEFALDFHRLIAADGGNVVWSPYSLRQVLAMTYAGARGETAEEMAAALRFDTLGDDTHRALGALDLMVEARANDKVEIATADQVWVQDGQVLVDEYLETIATAYGAGVGDVDFAGAPDEAKRTIDEWVAEQTHDRIEELFAEIPPDAAVVLADAVYLKAAWAQPFHGVGERPFRQEAGGETEVPTMGFDEYLPLAANEEWTAVEIPYSGDELSMVVIDPAGDLRDFERQLDAALLERIVSSLREDGIHLTMPKWTFEWGGDSLNAPLQELGIRRAFDDADFTGMLEGGGVWLGEVVQRAFIEVNEEGTEAAAASGAMMLMSHGPTVEVTSPFLFLIRDRETGTILFMGRVADPGVIPGD